MDQQHNHKHRERKQQHYEPFVVPVPETIVNEHAVVIKLLDAPVAEIAVLCVLWPQILTVDANVVEMVLLADQLLQQSLKIVWLFNVAWIHKHRK